MSRSLVMLVIPVSLLTLAAACPSQPLNVERIPAGTWGGDHVLMVVSDTGASIEYDCARGSIRGPLVVGTRGAFDLTGEHVREHGGPVRENEPPDSHPARYTGATDGTTITITVTTIDGSTPPFTVKARRGETAHVFKCL